MLDNQWHLISGNTASFGNQPHRINTDPQIAFASCARGQEIAVPRRDLRIQRAALLRGSFFPR